MTEPHGRQPTEVAGYESCRRCNGWVLREVSSRTGGHCSECFLTVGHMRTVEIVGRGRRTQVRLKPALKHKPLTDQRKQARKLSEKAKDRARKRLAAIFTDAFDIILAEERAALGLNPWPTEMAVRAGDDPDGSVSESFARLIHELDKVGAVTQ